MYTQKRGIRASVSKTRLNCCPNNLVRHIGWQANRMFHLFVRISTLVSDFARESKKDNEMLQRKHALMMWSFIFALYGINLMHPRISMAQNDPASKKERVRDLYSDTWVGVDGLGRPLPTYKDVGPPRKDRTVGMFYFLTFASGGEGPYDNTKILAAHPDAMKDIHNPAWGPLNMAHYWGEPLFGYYVSDDKSVLRKHAQMLENAGVDTVIFDNSNAVTYDQARNTLCKVWESMRQVGDSTPRIAFLCPFGNPGGIGTMTLRELYDTLYAPDLYPDLWFEWKGKPLVMADPSYAEGNYAPLHEPAQLVQGDSLGQSFTADSTFLEVGGEFPTWNTTGSGMTMVLREKGPNGRILARRRVVNVVDNSTVFVSSAKPVPPGKYYLEVTDPVGQIGWWSYSGNVYDGGTAYEGGDATVGDRTLWIGYSNEAQPVRLSPGGVSATPAQEAAISKKISDFFTFRTPIAPYNIKNPLPDHWAWLQVYPQAPQRDLKGNIEEVTVGVAQNYNATVNNTAPMSVPGAFGRSYHDGREDTRPGAVNWGYNVAEQWKQALKLDPPFIFITGWNEWTAGFMDHWVSWTAPPPIFVDEFNEEYSRDIEPMRGGHGDDYYYQLVSFIRRYKGVRPLPPVKPMPITMNGKFSEWDKVTPEYRDAIGDPVHRNAPGVGQAGPYVNNTGRNDIVAAKVSYDKKYLFFYVRTYKKMTPHTDPDWMLLYINSDANYKTGWLGYDYVVNRHVGENVTSLERNVGGKYQWTSVMNVKYVVRGNQMEIAIPRKAIGIDTLPATIDFKWADNCYAKGDWTDFTLNGDAAPDDRFNYRAKLIREFP